MFPLLLAAAHAGPHTALVGFDDRLAAERAIARHGGHAVDCFERARICIADFPDLPPIQLLAPEDWTATAFSPGDTLSLPDAGSYVATGSGTLLEGPLDARTSTTLALSLRAREAGVFSMTARLVATSAGAACLNAPGDAGEDDETGFLAWHFSVTATEASQGDTGIDPGEMCPEGSDDCPSSCGCGGGGVGPWWLGLFALARRR